MKSIGIVRKTDNLGRIVLPMELRRELHIDVGDSLEIFVDGQNIVLRKYQPGCVFCGELTERVYRGQRVCERCAGEVAV